MFNFPLLLLGLLKSVDWNKDFQFQIHHYYELWNSNALPLHFWIDILHLSKTCHHAVNSYYRLSRFQISNPTIENIFLGKKPKKAYK